MRERRESRFFLSFCVLFFTVCKKRTKKTGRWIHFFFLIDWLKVLLIVIMLVMKYCVEVEGTRRKK